MYDVESLAQRLGTVKHFHSLAPADLTAIISTGKVRRYPAGTTLFVEDEPGAGLYVLIQGQVQLRKLGPRGQEQIMAVIEPVIMFNEVPALDGGPNVATAVASHGCVVWRIDHERFRDLLQRYPQLGMGLLHVLATRNRLLVAQVEDLSFRSIVSRSAKLLLDLSDGGRQPVDRQANPNLELAARVATVPEAFSRALALLRKSGYVRCTRGEIWVLQPEALAEMACLD